MGSPIIWEDQSGLSGGLSALSQAIQQQGLLRQQQQQQQQQQQAQQAQQQSQQGALQKVLSQANLSTPEGQQAFLSKTSEIGIPITDSINILKQQSDIQELGKQEKGIAYTPEKRDNFKKLLYKMGMSEEESENMAELWGELTSGGQTEMAKVIFDKLSRGKFRSTKKEAKGDLPQEGVISETETEGFEFPEVDIFEDRTPKERASLKGELLKENNKEYKALSQKIQKINGESMRYDQLERLNNTGKLPSGIQMMNVNWTTGDLRIPQLANAETQLFVKTINDFTVAAKDSFGARVTNFELGAFLKRLPTLANTEEGRRLILSQMKAIKDLDRLYESSIKEVYDQYGLQKIDRASAERIAEDYRKDEEGKLKEDFANAIQAQEVYEAKTLAPEGKIPVRTPEGRIAYVWRNQADKAEEKGYKPL